MSNTKSNYQKLRDKDVSLMVQKKGNQSYLSWASAWALLKEEFPTATRTVYEDPNTNLNYFTDGHTAYVKVGVTIEDLEHIDYLPVMDFRNQAIKLEKVTMFDINKTIQRSTAKAIGMHGLGLTLWIGEDLVESANKKTSQRIEEMAKKIKLNIGDSNWSKASKYIEANKNVDFKTIKSNLEQKYIISNDVELEIKKILA